jgi:hypothetical protein
LASHLVVARVFPFRGCGSPELNPGSPELLALSMGNSMECKLGRINRNRAHNQLSTKPEQSKSKGVQFVFTLALRQRCCTRPRHHLRQAQDLSPVSQGSSNSSFAVGRSSGNQVKARRTNRKKSLLSSSRVSSASSVRLQGIGARPFHSPILISF